MPPRLWQRDAAAAAADAARTMIYMSPANRVVVGLGLEEKELLLGWFCWNCDTFSWSHVTSTSVWDMEIMFLDGTRPAVPSLRTRNQYVFIYSCDVVTAGGFVSACMRNFSRSVGFFIQLVTSPLFAVLYNCRMWFVLYISSSFMYFCVICSV